MWKIPNEVGFYHFDFEAILLFSGVEVRCEFIEGKSKYLPEDTSFHYQKSVCYNNCSSYIFWLLAAVKKHFPRLFSCFLNTHLTSQVPCGSAVPHTHTEFIWLIRLDDLIKKSSTTPLCFWKVKMHSCKGSQTWSLDGDAGSHNVKCLMMSAVLTESGEKEAVERSVWLFISTSHALWEVCVEYSIERKKTIFYFVKRNGGIGERVGRIRRRSGFFSDLRSSMRRVSTFWVSDSVLLCFVELVLWTLHLNINQSLFVFPLSVVDLVYST